MASKRKKRITTDAVAILFDRLVKNKPEMEALLAEAEAEMDVAEQIYNLRTQAGFTQQELADKIGTTASTICRLENADYEGHSLSMLRRIAAALNHRIKLSFVPLEVSTPV